LRQFARSRPRSHDTTTQVHLPLLASAHFASPNHTPTVVLLGDSMFERLKTTGQAPVLDPAAPWPWPALLDDDDDTLASLGTGSGTGTGAGTGMGLARVPRVFNAGVGGDTAPNIAYRLAGDADADAGLGHGHGRGHGHGSGAGAARVQCRRGRRHGAEYRCGVGPGGWLLARLVGVVRVWVVQAGTNHLRRRRGMARRDVARLGTLVRCLLLADARCRVLVTGLFYRRDVEAPCVDEANRGLAAAVRAAGDEFGADRVAWLPAPAGLRPEVHLDDHVHLNLEGYRLWMRELLPAVVEMLRAGEEEEEEAA
ncbi:hypothetical protein BT67DRAFT_378156, partial [Trichocladium antarcticum]